MNNTPIFQTIRNKLEQNLKPQLVEIVDVSAKHAGHAGTQPGGETHFELRIVAEAFRGLSRVKQHQLIYDILHEEMGNPIHALQIHASAPAA